MEPIATNSHIDLQRLRLVVFDVDGVLTDGSIIYDSHGVETKAFYVRDGFGIRAARFCGLKVGVLTGRSSIPVTQRVTELNVDAFIHGCDTKGQGIEDLCARLHVDLQDAAYLGDDVLDLPAMLRVGYPMAVANAVDEAKQVAHYVTRAHGGKGAAREAVEHILKARGQWDAVLERFGE